MAIDIYAKDTKDDFGTSPSQGDPLWISPDIIPRKKQVANYTAPGAFPEDAPADDIEQGHDNFVYARIRSRINYDSASNVMAKLYWSEPGTLATPGGWNVVGQVPVLSPSGGTVIDGSQFPVVGEIRWPSANIPGIGHHCFVLSIWSDDDPEVNPNEIGAQTFAEWVRNQNNIAWRNFNVAAAAPSPPPPPPAPGGGRPDPSRYHFFRVWANTPSGDEDFVMRLGLTAKLPRGSITELEGEKDFLERINPLRRSVASVVKVNPELPAFFRDQPGPLVRARGAFMAIDRFGDSLSHRLPLTLDRSVLLSPTKFLANKHQRLAVNIWIPRDAMTEDLTLTMTQHFQNEVIGGITWKLARPFGNS